MKLDYTVLPEHLRGGMQRYIEKGIPTGHFLEAVLSNDLMGAFRRGDSESQRGLASIASFLYNQAPAWCFGSSGNYSAWLRHGGLAGGANEERS